MPFAHGFDVSQGPQGVVFALRGDPWQDRRQTTGSWETELRKGTPFICVRSSAVNLNKSLASVAEEAHGIAQAILDIVAVEERNPLFIVEPEDNIVWRMASQGLKLQMTSSIAFAASMSMKATVKNAAGQVIPDPPYMPPQHHYAYSYFRYSQGSQNVLDAYRNMFLALESVLDHVDHKQASDKETEWIRRSLTTAIQTRGLSLSAFARLAGKDPVEQFLNAHYSAVRCAVFHAKSSVGKGIVPGSLGNHEFLVDQLVALQGLVEHLLKSEFNVSLPQAGFYFGGFRQLLSQLTPVMGLLISESECPTIEELMSGEGLPAGTAFRPVKFEGQNAAKADECLFVSESNPARHDISKVDSLRLVAPPNDHLFLSEFANKFNRTLLPTDLDLAGVGKFVAVVRCILRNVKGPKRGFSF